VPSGTAIRAARGIIRSKCVIGVCVDHSERNVFPVRMWGTRAQRGTGARQRAVDLRADSHPHCYRQNKPFCKQDVRLSETNGKYLTLDGDHRSCLPNCNFISNVCKSVYHCEHAKSSEFFSSKSEDSRHRFQSDGVSQRAGRMSEMCPDRLTASGLGSRRSGQESTGTPLNFITT
jgi:hypothetical protein